MYLWGQLQKSSTTDKKQRKCRHHHFHQYPSNGLVEWNQDDDTSRPTEMVPPSRKYRGNYSSTDLPRYTKWEPANCVAKPPIRKLGRPTWAKALDSDTRHQQVTRARHFEDVCFDMCFDAWLTLSACLPMLLWWSPWGKPQWKKLVAKRHSAVNVLNNTYPIHQQSHPSALHKSTYLQHQVQLS